MFIVSILATILILFNLILINKLKNVIIKRSRYANISIIYEKKKNKEYFNSNNASQITGISNFFPDGVIDIGSIKTNIPTSITTV